MTLKPRLSPQREEILRLYAKGLSVIEMAKALGVSRQRIYTQLENLDLPVPTKRNEKAS
jgi:DNA-binding CsgD family transcriptional regulator